MLKRNQIWVGLIIGLLIPFVGYALLLVILEEIHAAGYLQGGQGVFIFRKRTILLMAICLNLIPFSFFQRIRHPKSMRGVLSATLIYSLVWIIIFGSSVIG
ncbi:MAG: hypothetical protein HRU40_14715 [Saprospiraceae bacterium]|nr:hypothetical protein [Saprospiraceae bacterium]